MEGSRPGESNGGATTLSAARLMNGLPEAAISLVRDYDIKGVTAMMAHFAHCPLEEQMEAFRKNLKLFKYPNAVGAFPEEDNAADEQEDVKEEEDGVDEDEEDGMGEDEETPKLQVPDEGERECKKPRLAEGKPLARFIRYNAF